MKNILIAALVGISFLTSGFWIGLRFAPMPKKPAPVVARAAPKPVDPKVAFSVDSLKRASENMLSINDALKAREQAVAAREKKAAQTEDELAAERAALDRVHAHFQRLYAEFQKRLDLVTDTETGALQRQVTIFGAMDPAQAVDLVRELDDSTVTRLFALMEDKPLAKLASAWKTKYPADSARLLLDLNGMGRVMARDKVDLPDAAQDADSTTPAPPDSTDVSTPGSAAPNTDAAAAPAADNPAPAEATDATAPEANTTTVASHASIAPTPAPLEPADDTIHGTESYLNAGTAPPAIGRPGTPDDQDMTTPPHDAAPASDSNNAPPDATPQNTAPAGNSATPAASASTDLPMLDSPGETAAQAAARNRPPPDAAPPAPAEYIPSTPTMRLAHDKPARFASTRND
jgi:hypothetical protein